MQLAALSAALWIVLSCTGNAYASSNGTSYSSSTTAAGRHQPGAGYIVLLRHDPVVAYSGDVPGLAPTQLQHSSKMDIHNRAVQAYAQFLDSQSLAAAAAAGIADGVQYHYKYTLAGFSTGVLSDQEVQALQQHPAVLAVRRQRLLNLKTHSTPRFLGLAANSSSDRRTVEAAWNLLGPESAGGDGGEAAASGYGVVIGVIDTGIWPEAESFSELVQPPLFPAADDMIAASCKAGGVHLQRICSNKIVGCAWFNKGWGGDQQTKTLFPEAYMSCRDENGHGTHVAAIAAGNHGVQHMFGSVSGTAPRARLAVYKAFWGKNAANTDSDTLAAIEQAVADRVDVINFSAGPSFAAQTFRDPVSMAFMGAARAGIFVASSAGNEGDKASTLTSVDPWATVVAASTHDRELVSMLQLQDGPLLEGVGSAAVGRQVGPDGLMLAEDAAAVGANRTEAALCYGGTLDRVQCHSKIVVCDRGGVPSNTKSLEVKRAGGIAMILLDPKPEAGSAPVGTLSVPTIKSRFADRAGVRVHVVAGNASGVLSFKVEHGRSGPRVADFSSRGPAVAGSGVLLKPDITAPGVDIYAATSPALAPHKQYAYMSGTSMAAPHIAGLAALLRQKHPHWSPMAIKSALMTSAHQQIMDGKQHTAAAASPLAMGAGHVDPTKMFNPGLVFDNNFTDWQKFLCGAERQVADKFCAACQEEPELCDPKNFNTASIALPNMLAATTIVVYRTVTSVLHTTATFWHNASLGATTSNHLRVRVSPMSFTLAPGESQRMAIHIQVLQGAPHKRHLSGGICWTSSENTVTRIPLVVSPVALHAPAEVSAALNVLKTDSQTIQYNVTSAAAGIASAQQYGLVPGIVRKGTLRTEYGTFMLKVPQGTALARFQLLQSDYPTSIDLDMEVSLDNQIISTSWTADTSNETLDLHHPAPGLYEFGIHLHSFAAPGRPIHFKLHIYLVHRVVTQNIHSLGVAREQLALVGTVALERVHLSVVHKHLSSAGRYLGLVEYCGGDEVLSRTVLSVS